MHPRTGQKMAFFEICWKKEMTTLGELNMTPQWRNSYFSGKNWAIFLCSCSLNATVIGSPDPQACPGTYPRQCMAQRLMIKKGREEKHLVPNSSPNVKSLANVPAICLVFLSNDYSPMITVLDYSCPCHRWNDYCMWTLTLVKLTEISWKKRWATKIPNFPVTIQVIFHYWWLKETETKSSHVMQLEIQNTWGVWEEIEEEIHTGWKGEAAEGGFNAATFGLWV